MVNPAGKAPRPDSLRPLNQPAPVEVECDARPYPTRVKLAGRWRRVAAVEDVWEADTEWWRERPVHRMYYRVVLGDGLGLTVFQDLAEGGWFQQRE